MNYEYKGRLLQTSQAANGTWICFIDGNDPLLPIQKTEAAALGAAKAAVVIEKLDGEGYTP